MAYELVLDPVVPQLGQDLKETPPVVEHYWLAEAELWVEEEPERRPRSSNKMAGRRKRKKRRKKKLPKTSSSTSSRRVVGAGDQDMHEDEFEEEVTTEYVQRADVLFNLHTVVFDTLHAEPLNSVHGKEVAGYLGEMDKFIEEKEIRRKETTLKHETLALNLYSDRTHLYIEPFGKCLLAWWKKRHRCVWRLRCTPQRTGLLLTSTCGQVCHEEWVEQTRRLTRR